jgi:recF protein
MVLNSLNITNFRNYKSLFLKLNESINIIYGKNGEGKTNILESIYYLGTTKSHRTSSDKILCKDNEKDFLVSGMVDDEILPKKIEIAYISEKKNLKVDETKIKKVSDFINYFNVIIFYPEELDIIKGTPTNRRNFINDELSGLQNTYYRVLQDFNKLLKMRNEYLKQDKFDEFYFEALTKHYIDKSILIYKMRKKFIERINEYIEQIYYDIMEIKDFKIVYKINDIDEDDINIRTLEQKYEDIMYEERKYSKTLFGPQKDDLAFFINGKNAKDYASQGQQRAAIIAFKLAVIELYKKYKNDTPILLLDDVFSELDNLKKDNLLKYISKNIQTIITTTELDNIDKKIIKKAQLIQVKNGIVKTEEVE